MRGFPDCFLLHLIFFLLITLPVLQGCATHMQTYPASQHEEQITRAAFERYLKKYEDECSCCIDAEVDVRLSVSGWFNDHTANLSGYLQAMEPGFIKFVALNPLGQPILVLSTNGIIFKSFNILEGKAYIGSAESETFRKFAPPGFEPQFFYYWLSGRQPPGAIEILDVRRDRMQNAYWLKIRYEDSGQNSLVLFDPETLVVLKQIFINGKGDHVAELSYEEFRAEHVEVKGFGDKGQEGDDRGVSGINICNMPTKLIVSSSVGSDKRIELKFFSYIPNAEFSSDEFELEIPDNLEQVIVN